MSAEINTFLGDRGYCTPVRDDACIVAL